MTTGAILAPNWLGDVIMSLPAVSALLAATPERSWTVLARPGVANIYGMARLPLQVEPLPHRRSLPRLAGAKATRELVIFPNSFHAALLGLRLGARRRVGYARDRRGWLLKPAVPVPVPGSLPAHESFYYLELLRRAGLVAELPAEDPVRLRVPLYPDPSRVQRWRRKLVPATPGADTGHIAALHVGASGGTAKCWLPERFAELAGELSRRGVSVVIVGGNAERELARKIRMLAPHPEQIKNLAGETSLEDLVALIAAVDVLVANDSGPMHVAGAVGTPVVALFGPTNEKATYPLAEAGKLRLVTAAGVACRPCKLHECPIDHRCMGNISVAQVRAEVDAVLWADKKVTRR